MGLALWAGSGALSFTWNMLPGIVKCLGFMPWFYLGEGLLLMFTGVAGIPLGNLVWVPVLMILFQSLCRLSYGVSRVHSDLGVPFHKVLELGFRILFLLIVLCGLALFSRMLFQDYSLKVRLIAAGTFYSSVALIVIYFFGLPAQLRQRAWDSVRHLASR